MNDPLLQKHLKFFQFTKSFEGVWFDNLEIFITAGVNVIGDYPQRTLMKKTALGGPFS